jgi:serine/threonine protein kinase
METHRTLSSNSLGCSFSEPDESDNNNKVDSEDEMNYNSSKYKKIAILTDLNTIVESEANIHYIDKIKYYNDYKLIKSLGEGSVCKVKLVEKNNVKYALKIINKNKLLKKKKFQRDENGKMVVTTPLEGILREISILKKVNHPNLVKLFEIMHKQDKSKLYLVLEYCEHGDLMYFDEQKNIFTVNKYIFEKHLRKSNCKQNIEKAYYTENLIRSFIRQTIRGLNYLHRIGVIHKDIKPNNILLDQNNNCKIIDFNFSSILENRWVDNVGKKVDCNDYFRPAEICDLNDYEGKKEYKGMPVDIWALGVTAYILSYNKFPFYSENNDLFELYDKIHKAEFEIPSKPKRSKYFINFLKRCLEKDPNKRITSEKIFYLKWLDIGQKENLKNQCERVVKFVPTKNEIYKNMVFFSTYYNDIEKLKDDKRPMVNKIANKIMEKTKNKGNQKIKIKFKFKNKKNDSNKKEEEKKE